VVRDDLKERVLAAARREPSPTRRGATLRLALALVVAVADGAAVFFFTGGPRLAGQSPASLLGAAVITVVAMWAAFGRGGSMLGRPRSWLLAVTLGAPAAQMAWALLCNSRLPEALRYAGAVPTGCLVLACTVAMGPLLAFALIRRESDPVHGGLAGAARGSALGSVAWIVAGLWCPSMNPAHLAYAHVLPICLLAAFGAWLGRWSHA
jgi:hypothetical protein